MSLESIDWEEFDFSSYEINFKVGFKDLKTWLDLLSKKTLYSVSSQFEDLLKDDGFKSYLKSSDPIAIEKLELSKLWLKLNEGSITCLLIYFDFLKGF